MIKRTVMEFTFTEMVRAILDNGMRINSMASGLKSGSMERAMKDSIMLE